MAFLPAVSLLSFSTARAAALFRRDWHAFAQRRHDVALEQFERARQFRQRQVAEGKAADQVVRAGFRKLRAQQLERLGRRLARARPSAIWPSISGG